MKTQLDSDHMATKLKAPSVKISLKPAYVHTVTNANSPMAHMNLDAMHKLTFPTKQSIAIHF